MISGWKQQSVQLGAGWVSFPLGHLLLSYVSSQAACFHTWHIRMCWLINVWALNGTQHRNVTHYDDVILAAKHSHAGKTSGLKEGSEGRRSERADACDAVQEPAGSASWVISLDKNTADCCCFWKRGPRTHWGWIKPIRLRFEAKLISRKTMKCPERPLGGVENDPPPR